MNRKVYTVSFITQYISDRFAEDRNLSVVFVRGEISGYNRNANSGHIYFTLKDKDAMISCAMFYGDQRGLDFQLANGQEVIVGGTIGVYKNRGIYQLKAKKITLAGDGELAEQYERLKKRLQAMGYFDEDRKLPIPRYVKRVGIVTAQTGQAIKDIKKVAGEKNPYVQLILYPARVQGEGAAESIAAGIRYLDEYADVDVMIVGRGGGSTEDLWAFNEEIVAHAIFDCRTPIISAVGHEGDVTISDLVADFRAPTPTKAAELAVYDVWQSLDRLYEYKDRMARSMLRRTEEIRDQLSAFERRLQVKSPENEIWQRRQRLDDIEDRLAILLDRVMKEKKHSLALLAGRLDSVSPLKKLQSGYAYVGDAGQNQIASVEQVRAGDEIFLTMADGTIEAVVEDTKKVTMFQCESDDI